MRRDRQRMRMRSGWRQSGVSLVVILVSLAVLSLGGGAAAWYFLNNGNGDEEANGASPDRRPILYYNLSPAFTVNFPHQGRQRYLQAEVSVMARDEAALEALREHMPVVRHNLNNLFSAQLIRIFDNPQGIEELRQLATEDVQRVLSNEIGRPGIEEVLFTTFVLQ